jgi:hypothetical protein
LTGRHEGNFFDGINGIFLGGEKAGELDMRNMNYMKGKYSFFRSVFHVLHVPPV